MSLPVIGPRLISDPDGRFSRWLGSWVGGGFALPDEDIRMYMECMRQPGHAEAGSRWYRSFQTREMLSWMRGEFDGRPRRRSGPMADWNRRSGVIPALVEGYGDRISDFEMELVDGVGHWIVEQRPELVLDRIRAFLSVET